VFVSLFYFLAYKKNAPKKVKEEIHQPIEES
ncbi:TPA: formate/nitrite transporter, partial [Listeria monocytogenes]|nr:formate/nitrite transporter [Listeria monocytogenes]EIT1187848.1 formate/nitrite transporter [Listeria monocytogenes]HBK0319764.1 formate/nitrite transporter [Listeria monocytogenes]